MNAPVTVRTIVRARGFLVAALAMAALAALLAFVTIPNAQAATSIVETDALRLEVTDSPYSYKLVEKATSEVILSYSKSYLTIGSNTYSGASLTNVVATGNTLEGDLTLSNVSTLGRVQFAFTSPEVLQVTLKLQGGTASRVQEEFNDQQEHYYGIWEYPFNGSLDNRGVDREFLGFGQEASTEYTSGRAPFYLTSKKYGIYAESQARGHYKVAVGGKTSFSFDTPELKYHVLYGPTYREVLERYTSIAGGASMPPLWAMDTIWWKNDAHADLHNATNAQGNVLDLANQLANNRIPASGILIDRPYGTGTMGWGNMDFDSSFPNPAQMVQALGDRGLNLMLWIANRAWNNLYTEGTANGYLFPNISSSLGPAADLRIPGAYDWFKQKLNALVSLGVKGYKIDRGEEGEQPDSAQNENVTLFAKLASEGLASARGADHFVFARNANDTARKYTALWNGDSIADFGGLKYSVVGGLRSGAINFPTWGSDTGGYRGTPTKELFARWLQFSAYSTMMEVLVGGGRTPRTTMTASSSASPGSRPRPTTT